MPYIDLERLNLLQCLGRVPPEAGFTDRDALEKGDSLVEPITACKKAPSRH
jgi:hypothetical protein